MAGRGRTFITNLRPSAAEESKGAQLVVLAVECRGLTKRYGGTTVVEGVDLQVETGELFGFLGPNGAGKTTVIRILLGLVQPDHGQAWVLGSRVPCPQRLAEIGALVEEPAFYPWMSGRRNLDVIAREGAAVAPGAAQDALDAVGLSSAAPRQVGTYSQGMRQRLGIAAAVLRRPALLLLDEPANGLDPAGIRELREFLRRLGSQGTTVFLSSHLLGEVEQLCDRVAVIDRGRLVSVGAAGRNGSAGVADRLRITVEPNEVAAATMALAPLEVTEGDAPGSLLVAGTDGRSANQSLALAGIYAAAIVADHLSLEERFLAMTQGGYRATAER
jgi:ABC-type multidrug transport system ATPase subunit